ncbi:MAG: hypothetical protein JXA98_05745 [Methanosarcinaceae archaeon]|nr:hypothetical protein [Methanosarcinaceae archaeon]
MLLTVMSFFAGYANAVGTEIEPSGINIDTSAKAVDTDQAFTVSISVDPSVPINGAQFNLKFTSPLVSAIEVREGNLFSQSGAKTFFSSGTIDNDAGTATDVYDVILGSTNVSSPGVLAYIDFMAGSTTGTATFSLSNIVISDKNSNAAPYIISTSDGSEILTIYIGSNDRLQTIDTYDPYDENEDSVIDISELSDAIDDFFAGTLEIGDLSKIIDYFFLGDSGYR